MNKLFLWISLLLAGVVSAQAQTNAVRLADSLWTAANDQYAAGAYDQALATYERIEKSGVESVALYHNMGNTYFKLQYVASAILYYERALLLDPMNADVLYNLSIAQEQCIDTIEPVPSFFLADWVRNLRQSLSSDAWGWITLGLLAAGLLFMLLFYFARNIGFRKVSFVLATLLFVLMCVCVVFSWQNRHYAQHNNAAIVFAAVSSVKSSPDAQGKDLLVIHEGTKVLVLETVGSWARIELLDGRQGWIALSEINFVHLRTQNSSQDGL